MNVGTIPLRHTAQVLVSNVDKKSNEGEPSVRLVNYTDVYYRDEITADLHLMAATATPDQVRRFGVRPGDTIITKDSETPDDIGVPAFVGSATPDMVCGYHLAMLRPREGIDPKYLYWAVASTKTRQQFSISANGMTRYGLTYDAIQSAEVPVLGLDEQRRIADFLDDQTARIDQIIAARRKQVALLRNAALERRREVTTIGMSTPRRSTGIEWMPEVARDWPVLRIARLFRTGSGTTPTTTNPAYFGGDIAWVNTGDITDHGISAIPKAVTEAALADFPALRVFQAGALVIAMYGQGATKGRVGVLPVSACVNQACCVLEPTGRVLVEWAAAWFQAHKDQIVELAIGSGQPNLSQEIIRSLRMPAPPIQTQRTLLTELATETAIITAACEGIERSIELLLEFKSSLTSAAVSGEFVVSAASGRGVPA